jgi:hypothetical protein
MREKVKLANDHRDFTWKTETTNMTSEETSSCGATLRNVNRPAADQGVNRLPGLRSGQYLKYADIKIFKALNCGRISKRGGICTYTIGSGLSSESTVAQE